MSFELLTALTAFAFVSSITPGPNNMMLLASGVNYGFQKTVPHMLGIACGFVSLLLAIGFGLGELLTRAPLVYTVIKYAGAAYMLWLAWVIANSGPVEDSTQGARGRPMRFIEAAAFQWVNPKAWVMAIGAMATYTNPNFYATSVLIVALVFGIINLPSVSVWTVFGVGMRRFLSDPRLCRIFNIAMALALAASLWPLAAEWLR